MTDQHGIEFALKLWVRLVRGVVKSIEDPVQADEDIAAAITIAAAMREFKRGIFPIYTNEVWGINLENLRKVAENLLKVVADSGYHCVQPPQAQVWEDEDGDYHLAWWGTWTPNRWIEVIIESVDGVVNAVVMRYNTGTSKRSSYLGLPHGLKKSWIEDFGEIE